MDPNIYIKKYTTRSNSELQKIVDSTSGYVIEAKFAAVQVLKTRGINLEIEKAIQIEFERLNNKKQTIEADKQIVVAKIIKNLELIPIGKKKKWLLENGNELRIKRLNEYRFHIRIEGYFRSSMAPVIMCEYKNNSTLKTYPFFYLEPILIALLIAALFVAAHLLGIFIFNQLLLVVSIIVAAPIVTQLLTAPVLYYIIKDNFESRLGK